MATVSRRRRRDEEAPDEDARGRRRSRDDDGDDNDDRGRGRSGSRSSRDGDDSGRRGSRSSSDSGRSRRGSSDDGDSRGRRGRRHSDEDGRSSRRGRDRDDADDKGSRRRSSTNSGWGGYESRRVVGTGSRADEFKPEIDDETVIKILDPEPFDTYLQVWVDDAPKKEPWNGRKSYYSGDNFEEGTCPLLAIGYDARTISLINVLNLGNPKKPVVEVWAMGVSIADQLQRLSESKRTSPLDREDLYFAVTRTKKGKRYDTKIESVKAENLEEDFDIEPFTADELEDYLEDRHTDASAVIKIDTLEDLQELADELD